MSVVAPPSFPVDNDNTKYIGEYHRSFVFIISRDVPAMFEHTGGYIAISENIP
jgi:hypothetical protein